MPKQIGEQTKKTVGVLLGGSGVNASTSKVNYISPKITTAKKVDAIDPSLAGLSAVQLLGSIYEELKKQETARQFESELDSRFQEEINLEEDLRHRELIKALTGRRPEKKVQDSKSRARKEEVTEVPKPKVEPKPKVTKKSPAKGRAAEAPKAPEAKPPAAPRAPEVKPPTPKAPEVKPPAAPAPRAPEVKPPTPKAPEVKPPAAPAPKPTARPAPKKEVPKPTAEKVPKPAPKPPAGTDTAVKQMIRKNEGFVPYPYKDSRGLWTIGAGHLIGDGKTLPPEYAQYKNNGAANAKGNNRTPAMSQEKLEELFDKDYEKHKAIAMRGPGWNLANDDGKAALIDLAFNMGEWWKKFPSATKSLNQGNFELAADELKYKNGKTKKEYSDYYKQVGNRAERTTSMLRRGKSTESQIASTVPPQPNSGTKIDKSSTENSQLHESLNNKKPAVIVNETTETNSKINKVQDKSMPQDDRPAWKKK
jgi:GH24 family phage-related lysozyme (muramidase)